MHNIKASAPFKAAIALTILALMLIFAAPSASCAETASEKKKDTVTLNFIDVEISAVAKFISELTGKNFVFDEKIKGKITIIAPTPMKPEDAFSLFTSVLELKALALLPLGSDAYKIVSASSVRQAGMEVTTEMPPINENYVVRVAQVKYISSESALRLLQPVITKNGHISSFGPGNLLLIVDTGLNIEKMLSILQLIDQPPVSEEPEVVFLVHADADVVARMLTEGMKKQTQKDAPPEVSKAVADKRLNAVILFGTKEIKDSMKRLIAMIDVPASETQSTINVYFLENADAMELSKVVQELMRPGSTSKAQQQGAKRGASPFEATSGITVTPDKATNSLVIVASPSDYLSIVQIIKQLDRRRRQVYVEAMIVEASLDKLKELGSKWRAALEVDGEPVLIGGVGTVDTSAMQSIISGLTGFSIGGMGNYMNVPITQANGTTSNLTVPGFGALFSSSEFNGTVNVLSSPQILTSDNTEAEIVVGENVPFISKKDLTNIGASSAIERKDVGITLKIKPQITEGDFVKLDIYQEISSVKEPSVSGAQAAVDILTSVGPTTTKRSTKTTVVVQDEQTVVIGGLMQEKEEKVEKRVPLLHRIPILGWLFKFKSTSKVKTNLLVFLTPHVIKDSKDVSGLTTQKQYEFAKKEEMFVEGELIVKFRTDITTEQAQVIIEKQKASIIESIDGTYRVRLKKGKDVKDALEDFMDMKEVQHVEPNYKIRTQGALK